MTQRVKRSIDFLRLIANTPSRVQRASLLKTITPVQLGAIGDVAFNILNGNVSVSQFYKKRLHKHRTRIRLLADKKVSVGRRKRALQPNLVSLLLESVAPALRVVAR